MRLRLVVISVKCYLPDQWLLGLQVKMCCATIHLTLHNGFLWLKKTGASSCRQILYIKTEDSLDSLKERTSLGMALDLRS